MNHYKMLLPKFYKKLLTNLKEKTMLLMIRCLCDIKLNNMMYINGTKKNEFIDTISTAKIITRPDPNFKCNDFY